MRRILTSFLIFAFLASVTICSCGHKAHAETGAISHRHDHDSGHSFTHDCKTADMQLPQQASIPKPELKISSNYYNIFIAGISPSSTTLTGRHEIRGPPPDWPDIRHTQPAPLSITQRLLI